MFFDNPGIFEVKQQTDVRLTATGGFILEAGITAVPPVTLTFPNGSYFRICIGAMNCAPTAAN